MEKNFKVMALNLLNALTGDTEEDLEYVEHILRQSYEDGAISTR